MQYVKDDIILSHSVVLIFHERLNCDEEIDSVLCKGMTFLDIIACCHVHFSFTDANVISMHWSVINDTPYTTCINL